jgi:hypothetical protein
MNLQSPSPRWMQRPLLRRVRLTLKGRESTRGAEGDVVFCDVKKVSGVIWPTDLGERASRPFKPHAQRWNLGSPAIHRGQSIRELKLSHWGAKAAQTLSALTP